MYDGQKGANFADWLRAHPSVRVVCRDQAGGYADGAHAGAPDAIQVADRWHLWDRLCQHVEKLVAAHHACLPEPIATDGGGPDGNEPVDPAVLDWPHTVRAEHTRDWYHRIHDLRDQRLSIQSIAARLDLNYKTVRRYLRAPSLESMLAGGVEASLLDPYKPYLHDRLAAGPCTATALYAEIIQHGYTGGYNTVARYVRPLRRARRDQLHRLLQRPPPPTVPQVAGWITGLPARLRPTDAARLNRIRSRCPELDAAVRHVAAFGRMIKNRSGDSDRLTTWINAVEADNLVALRTFTAGLRRDFDAVTAGLTLEYNSGAVEGTVNRIQTLKTQMYGRAKPDLLRKRILLA